MNLNRHARLNNRCRTVPPCHCEGGRTPDRGNLLLSLRAKRSNPVNINLFASANAFLWIATPLTWLAMTRTVDCTQTRVTFSVICTLHSNKNGAMPRFLPNQFLPNSFMFGWLLFTLAMGSVHCCFFRIRMLGVFLFRIC